MLFREVRSNWTYLEDQRMKVDRAFMGVLGLSLMILWARLVPHSANFSPVLALCLVCGFLGQGRWFGIVLPFSALLFADIRMGFYPGWMMTYMPLLLAIWVGTSMKFSWSSILGRGFVGAVLFFILSNLGVWKYSGLYSQDQEGLIQCFTLALPFFRTTLVSTFLGLGLFSLVGYIFRVRLTQMLLERNK